jgi:hypothetical protein
MKLSKRKYKRKRKTMKNKKGGMRSSTRNSRANVRTGSKTSANSRSASVSKPVAVKSYRRPSLAPIVEDSLRGNLKKTIVKNLDRDTLSGKIQWLMDFGGDADVIESIKYYFGDENVQIVSDPCNDTPGQQLYIKNAQEGNYKKTMYFQTQVPSASECKKIIKDKATAKAKGEEYEAGPLPPGHWIYFDKSGKKWNAYVFDHQRDGTNQFCQTFAILYMLHDKPSRIPDFSTDLQKKTDKNIGSNYTHNIRVAIEFWRYIFENGDPELKIWMFDRLKEINNNYISENIGKDIKDQTGLIAEDSDDINLALINSKLDDIDKYADEISKGT